MRQIPPIIESHDGEAVSPELGPLLRRLHAAVVERPGVLDSVVPALRSVLKFLASPAGRTNANCWAADLFCMADEGWGEGRWEHLPEPLADILGDMAGALHDTVSHPDVARNFESTPEQLLERLEQFELGGRPA